MPGAAHQQLFLVSGALAHIWTPLQPQCAPVCRRSRLRYGPDIDIWSAGCIFAELLAGSPIFGKDTEVDALYAICKTCGSPDPVDWPEVTALPGWEACRKEFRQSKLRTDLLRKINDRRRVRGLWSTLFNRGLKPHATSYW